MALTPRTLRHNVLAMITIHATTIAIDGAGAILRGPSGSGKSDLALRLIDRGAQLIADDQTVLFIEDGRLMAQAPPEIAGKMEVRGVGVIPVGPPAVAPVALLIDLVDLDDVPRIPTYERVELVGFKVPAIKLDPFELSAAAKVRLALRTMPGRDNSDEI